MRVEARGGAGGGEEGDEIGEFCGSEIRKRAVRPALRREARDVAFAGVAFEAGAVPGAEEHLAGGIDVEVGDLGNLGELLGLLRERRAVGSEAVEVNRFAAPVGHEGLVVVVGGPGGFGEEQGTDARTAAEIFEGGENFSGEIFEEAWVSEISGLDEVEEADIPAAAIVGVAAREEIHERVDGDIVVVAGAGGEELEFGAVGADARDAAALERDLGAVGAGGVVETEIADGDVDPAINPHANAVGGVVGAPVVDGLGDADAFDEDFRRTVGDAVAVGVFEHGEVHAGGFAIGAVGGVQDVDAGANSEEAAGVVDGGEDGVRVGDAVAVAVDEFHDAALAGAFAEGAVEIDAGVDLALGGNAQGRYAGRDVGAGEAGEDEVGGDAVGGG